MGRLRPSLGAAAATLAGPRADGFRRLWLATAVSVLGTWAAAVALSVQMWQETHSPAWVSALFVAEFVPPVIVGLAFGARLNRMRPRRGMVAADLASAGVFALLVVIREPALVVALAGAAGVAAGVFRPLSMAAVPLLVRDEELEAANGALAGVDNTMTFAAQAAGGILVAVAGPAAVLAVNAVSFLASAVLLGGCRPLAAAPAGGAGGSALAAIRASVASVRRSPALVQIALVWPLVLLLAGATNAVEVPLLLGPLDATPVSVGFALAATSAGIVAGSLAAGRLGPRLARIYPLAVVALGAGWALCGLAGSVAAAMPVLALMGIANGVALVHNRTDLQRHSSPAERAGLIALLVAAGSAATMAGAVAGGTLATVFGPRAVFVAAGIVAVGCVLPLVVLLDRRARALARSRGPGTFAAHAG
jgi:MFS family permease